MTRTEAIQLSEIKIDGGTQQRERIDLTAVSEYAEAMRCGEKFPPVALYYDGAQYWLADGFHRYHASVEAEMLDILAVVHTGTRRDAILFSASANAHHGIRPTTEDKRRAALALLKDDEWSKWSDRDIAKHCHVSHTFVSKLRKETEGCSKKLKPTSSPGNVATPKAKPDTLPTPAVPLVIPKREGDPEDYDPREDRIAELSDAVRTLSRENDHLRDQIAVGLMPTPEIDGTSALETIMALRSQVDGLETELAAVRATRDSYQRENADLKIQCKRQRAEIDKLKKAAQ